MGLYYNGNKIAQPHINGRKCNAYVNGRKLWNCLPNIIFYTRYSSSLSKSFVIYSQNGINWHAKEAPASYDGGYNSYLTKDLNKFLAVISNNLLIFDKTLEWEQINLPILSTTSSYHYYDIIFHNGLYLITINQSFDDGLILYSYNRTDWTVKTIASTEHRWFHNIRYIKDRFVIFEHSGNDAYIYNNKTTLFSYDGINDWTNADLPLITGVYNNNTYRVRFTDAFFGNNKYVITGKYNTIISSSDFVNWDVSDFPDVTIAGVIHLICYHNNKFVVITEYGYVYESSNGITWSKKMSSLPASITQAFYYNGNFFVFNYNNKIALFSTDVINWTEFVFPFHLFTYMNIIH